MVWWKELAFATQKGTPSIGADEEVGLAVDAPLRRPLALGRVTSGIRTVSFGFGQPGLGAFRITVPRGLHAGPADTCR